MRVQQVIQELLEQEDRPVLHDLQATHPQRYPRSFFALWDSLTTRWKDVFKSRVIAQRIFVDHL